MIDSCLVHEQNTTLEKLPYTQIRLALIVFGPLLTEPLLYQCGHLNLFINT